MMNSFNEIIDFDFKKTKVIQLLENKNRLLKLSVLFLIISGLTQFFYQQIFVFFVCLTALSFCVYFGYKFYHHQKYTISNTTDFVLSILFCVGVAAKFILPALGNFLIFIVLIILSTIKIIPLILGK